MRLADGRRQRHRRHRRQRICWLGRASAPSTTITCGNIIPSLRTALNIVPDSGALEWTISWSIRSTPNETACCYRGFRTFNQFEAEYLKHISERFYHFPRRSIQSATSYFGILRNVILYYINKLYCTMSLVLTRKWVW